MKTFRDFMESSLYAPEGGYYQSRVPTEDFYTAPDQFLAEKGLDTRLGACQYYKAIGAVKGCDASGNLIAPITFDDWKRAVKFGPYAKRMTLPEEGRLVKR